MPSTLVHIALFVVFAARHVVAQINIDTPALTQCQNVNLQWSGGKPPYNIYVVPTSDPCADSLVDIPEQNGQSLNWKVNLPKGSKVELLVEDANSDEGWSNVITVGDSADSSCVDQKAAVALSSPNPPSSSASSDAYGPASPGSDSTPAADPQEPTETGPAVANEANGHNTSHSGSIPRAMLPTGSLLATVAFLVAVYL